jgi:hypothetical protein
MNQHDIKYNLSNYLNELKENQKIKNDYDFNNLKSIYYNQIVPYYKECTESDKLIIDYLLIKINDSLYKYFNQSLNNLINITNEQFESLNLKIEISFLTNVAKNEDGNSLVDILFIQKSTKCLHFIDEYLKDSDDDFKIKILIMIKNILKSMLNSNLDYDELISIKAKILFNFDSFMNLENIYLMIKYLKIIDLVIEKHHKISQLKQLVETFIQYLITNYNGLIKFIKKKCDFKETKITSIDHTVYNHLYIKIIMISLKSLMIIRKDLYKPIYESIDDEKIDLIYKQGIDDDQIINFNLYFLDMQLNQQNKEENLFDSRLNVHRLFFKLVSSISFDYEIIVEWLISNETSFLKYFVKYLKIFINDLVIIDESTSDERQLRNKCLNSSEINQIVSLFKQLNVKIDSMKRSFPYNCQPLIKLLNKV